jgi:hypothetical protein
VLLKILITPPKVNVEEGFVKYYNWFQSILLLATKAMHIISFFGVDRQYRNLREEILDITDRVYSTGRVLDGEYTREFELR